MDLKQYVNPDNHMIPFSVYRKCCVGSDHSNDLCVCVFVCVHLCKEDLWVQINTTVYINNTN